MKLMRKWLTILFCALVRIAQAEWGYFIEGNAAVITSAPCDLAGAVTVPSQLGGCPVVSIGDWVGAELDEITSLTIPASVTNVGRSAFMGCRSLSSVTIGDAVLRIGQGAFRDTPFCDAASDKSEVCSLGNWALGLKTLVAKDESEAERLFCQIYEATVPAGTKHVADYAFERAHIRLRADRYSDRSARVGKVTLPEGLESLGEGAFNMINNYGYVGKLIIPASVARFGSHALACPDQTVIFCGDRPTVPDDVFKSAYGSSNGGVVGTVHYDASRTGWTYGGTWCGVRTFPWSWPEKRVSSIALGAAYEYDRDVADHELTLKEEVEDDEYVAIPVYGASSAAEIHPVVLHHNSSASDIASIEIRTDAQMFSAIVQPLLKYRDQWNSSGGYHSLYLSQAEGKWPIALWPDDVAVSGRFWILVKPNPGTWYGMRDFRIGLFGTDEVTDRIYLANDSTYGPSACDKACLDTRRVAYGGRIAPRMHYGRSFVLGGIGTDGDCLGGTEFWTEGVKPASFTATVTEPGRFVMSVDDYQHRWFPDIQTNVYVGENFRAMMTVSGGVITDDAESCHHDVLNQFVQWPNYEDFDSDEDYQSALKEFLQHQQYITDEAMTNMYWRHGGGSCVRRVTVGKAGSYTFASKSQDDIAVNRFHFFPMNRPSVAIDAICMTAKQYYMCSHDIAYGYVLGSGVFVAGETATFTAVPAPGERFDRWEVAFADNCQAVSDAFRNLSLTSPTLSFAVTEEMCGAMTDERQIVLRAVWKKKRRPEIIPSPVGAATVRYGENIFEGEAATVTLTAAENCTFARWLDDASCGLVRTFSFDDAGGDEPMRVIFNGTPDIKGLGCLGTYGPYVPGEKMSLIVGELVGYTAKGLPGGLKLNRNTGEISGTPTKPTESAGVSVAFTKKNAETLTAKFVVGPFPQLAIEMIGTGTVKGAGAYAANKKVSIKATPAKGQVFAGWFVGKDGEGLIALPGTVDYRTPNCSYVMPARDATLYAKFADAAEDQVIGLKVGRESVTANADDTVFETGGTLVLDVEATSVTVPKVVMSGLPNGLKFTTKLVTSKVTTGSGANRVTTLVTNALPNQIYGSATKPGTYVVTAKLTNTTVKKAIERKFRIVVDNLTAANGLIRVIDDDGAATSLANARGESYVLTVGVAESVLPARITSSVGTVKVTGLPSGLKYDAKTGSLAGVATKAGTYTASVTVGKAVSTFTIIVEPLPDWAVGTFGGVIADKCEGELRFYGTVDLSVSTTGKLSAKIVAGGKTYVFSTFGFVSAGERDSYHFKMTTRAGEVYEGTLDAAHYDVKSVISRTVELSDVLSEFVPNGQNPYRAVLWRNEHGKDGHISDDVTGRLEKTFNAIKSIRTFDLKEWDSAYGNVKVTFKANGATSVSGTAADGTKLSASSFLKLDGPSYHVVADVVVFDKKSGRVYCGAICWEPTFADDGSISGWSECCDHSLLSYPFVR